MNWFVLLAAVNIDPNDLNVPKTDVTPDTLHSVFQIVFGILGAVSVFMISFAAFRFVIARGNPEAVAKARNTIIYSAIGLIVSLIAFSIVTFVIGRF